MPAFFASDEKQMLSGLSAEISRHDNKNPIALVPDQFQVWRLGEIDDEGNVTAEKQLVCTCNTLVRVGRQSTEPRGGTTPAEAGNRIAGTLGLGGNSRADAEALSESKATKHSADENQYR